MSDIKIRKAKIAKGGTVEASFYDRDGNDITLKGKNICHPDLKAAFAGLVPFLADLTEQKEADRIDWYNLDDAETVESLRYLEVTGFSISEDDVNPMVTLIGKRTLRSSASAPCAHQKSSTYALRPRRSIPTPNLTSDALNLTPHCKHVYTRWSNISPNASGKLNRLNSTSIIPMTRLLPQPQLMMSLCPKARRQNMWHNI